MKHLTELAERGVVAVAGRDRVAFLQGLVSNDIAAAAPGHAVWTALLTPQGKWLADFFVFSDAERLLLDCEAEQVAPLVQRLSRYRLRMDVQIVPVPEVKVFVAWGDAPSAAGIVAPDPRLPDFAWRILSADGLACNATPRDWDAYRLAAGLPDGSKDLEADRTVLLEAGFDELNGVSWSKGCYMGQELTARTRYRGLIKRRLIPVDVVGKLPERGTPVTSDGAEVGTMRSGRDGNGIAVLRLEALGKPLRCGDAVLAPRVPAWMRLPEREGAA